VLLSVLLLLVLLLLMLLLRVLLVLLLLVLLQMLPKGAYAITLLPTNRVGIGGVTHPGKVLSLSHAETHFLCHAKASTSKTFETGCSVK